MCVIELSTGPQNSEGNAALLYTERNNDDNQQPCGVLPTALHRMGHYFLHRMFTFTHTHYQSATHNTTYAFQTALGSGSLQSLAYWIGVCLCALSARLIVRLCYTINANKLSPYKTCTHSQIRSARALVPEKCRRVFYRRLAVVDLLLIALSTHRFVVGSQCLQPTLHTQTHAICSTCTHTSRTHTHIKHTATVRRLRRCLRCVREISVRAGINSIMFCWLAELRRATGKEKVR